jgi:hypothetical protein
MATLVDLWYVTHTTEGVDADQLAELRGLVMASPVLSSTRSILTSVMPTQ